MQTANLQTGVDRGEIPQSIDRGDAWMSLIQLRLCAMFAGFCITAAAGGGEPLAADKDWDNFRGPGRQGVSTITDLPLEWSLQKNLAWKTALPGAGASSPIVSGNRVLLTCYSGYLVPGQEQGRQADLQRHLIFIDKATGRITRQIDVAAKLPEEERIREHGFAASSPATDGELICCFFGKSGVIAWDFSGRQIWQTDVGSGTHGWGSAASPVFHGDLVFINASVESQSLVALDRKTGREVWRAGEIREAWNTPLVVRNSAGNEELVIGTLGTIRSYDPLTGELLWTCATDIQWYMVPSPVAHDGVIYYLGGRSGTASLAVRCGGRGDVTQTHRLWTSQRGSNVSSPVFHDGCLYWIHDSRQTAYCMDAATGELIYEERVNRAGQVYSSALLADDRIYYLTRTGRTVVVPAAKEFRILADNDLNDGTLFNGSPAVDGRRLLIRSDKWLYCLQTE